ncbi:Gfo/Idh/MocA family oxidoreductase [Pendulispora rubella]|uniref:Gfo/Idh/MocA family oxidoreductase n=1 Tax=Pendulispora rubella TaxID=2741070 RepID=A0ABZ2L4B7_9BACT
MNTTERDTLAVGIIGLGDIAQKAYLPVLTALPGLDVRLMTRDASKLDRIGAAYRIAHRYTDLEALVNSGLQAAFVHASTDQHVPIVARLLQAGVHVYVDKPLDYTLEGSRHLVELAEKSGLSLFVGFNRRYAPAYVEARQRPRDLVVFQKHRRGCAENVRTAIFDDFVHVVDTLRFFAPGEVEHVDVRARVHEGRLEHVVLTLSGAGFTALGVQNRVSGSTEEVLEVSGADAKRQVLQIADVVDHDRHPTMHRRGEWVPVSRQRGLEQACQIFLDAVRSGTILSARDALRTHELCEHIVEAIARSR